MQMVTAAMKLRHLLLGIAMTNLDSILKSRDITLSTKVYIVKATVFPVVMHGHVSWTIKKAEQQRIDALELWGWRRLLRVTSTAKSNPNGTCSTAILREISPEYSLGGLMLKLQYFVHVMRRADSLEKTLLLGILRARGEGSYRGQDGWMASPTQQTWVRATQGDHEGQRSLMCHSAWCHK